MKITNKRQLLIGKNIGWKDGKDGKFLHLFTISKFTPDGKKYYRTYSDYKNGAWVGTGEGEYMLTDILLKNLDTGKYIVEGMDISLVRAICKGRKSTAQEKLFERQLSYYENYGTVKQGKI